MPVPLRRPAIRLAVLVAAALFTSAPASVSAQDAPLAIGGYDPVAYFTLERAVPGKPEIEYVWDEHRYRFSLPEHRELFKADPVRYAPQFANFCAVALARGEFSEANPEYWLISDGKLYLFGKSIGPRLFQQDLARNVARASENKAAIATR